MKERVKQWFQKNAETIGRLRILTALLLVGVIAFEAGLLQGKMRQEAPLVLSIPALAEEIPMESSEAVVVKGVSGAPKGELVVAGNEKSNCVFVGSKNSDKYHLPSCSAAKRIKAENRVCFASKEEAEKRGYVPSCVK
jgi:hypothetical protein